MLYQKGPNKSKYKQPQVDNFKTLQLCVKKILITNFHKSPLTLWQSPHH